MDPAWLTKKVTVEQAEAEHLVRDERLGPEPVPFGFMRQDWKQLIAEMQPGDELWEFESPLDTWQHLCGRAGFAIVRNNNPIASLVTRMN